MTELKHTPGPWTCGPTTNSEWIVYLLSHSPHEPHKSIAKINNWENSKANAKLISAAPDLLEACQYVVNWHLLNDSGEGELFGLDFVTTCISAIKKATE